MSDMNDNGRVGLNIQQELSTCSRLAKDEEMAGRIVRCQMKHRHRPRIAIGDHHV